MKKEVREVIESLIPIFEKDEHILQAILFGSQVRNEAIVNSNIDIAIVSGNLTKVDRGMLRYATEMYNIDCDFAYVTPESLKSATKELDVKYWIKKRGKSYMAAIGSYLYLA